LALPRAARPSDAALTMLLSIVVINYNYDKYVRQAIESALTQSYTEIEVVVVDDGSTDNSRDTIASFGSRVRLVSQPNGGLTCACNTGWRHARGEAVLFLDADDVVLPDMAAKVMAVLKTTDAVKVQYLLYAVDGELNRIGHVFPTYGISSQNIRRDIAQWGYYLTPPQSGNVYRRAFLDKILPAPENGPYVLPMDGYATGLAGLDGRVATLDEPLGLYRIHGNNMSEGGQAKTVHKIREWFMRDYVREETQGQWAERLGWRAPYRTDLARFHPTVCKQRFIAYRLDPVGHPIATDGRWSLLLAGIWGAVRFPYLAAPKRLFIAAGFLGIALMPKAMLRRVAGPVLSSGQKPSFLQFILENLKRGQA
jgi:glycosyltransferase involved in cell wall biosynthesis